MLAWPAGKMNKATLFTFTGLDYLGPFYVKGQLTKKVWICLFTCLTIRAIHLEVKDDMTAEQFLMALRRFIPKIGTAVITKDDEKIHTTDKPKEHSVNNFWSFGRKDKLT